VLRLFRSQKDVLKINRVTRVRLETSQSLQEARPQSLPEKWNLITMCSAR
jgi:hypothetical protein